MRNNFVLMMFFCFFACAAYSQVYADVVRLKNGRQIEGEILIETDKAVILKIKIGQVTFKREDIESVEKTQLPLDFFEDEIEAKPTKGPMPTIKKEPVQQVEVELKAEGYSKVSPPKFVSSFNLDINAQFKRTFDGDAIFVEGTTNLPPKTVLYLMLKSSTQTIAVQKLFVENTSFLTKIGPFGNRRITPGLYVVEAIFSPEKQESEDAKELLADAREIMVTSDVSVGSPREFEEKAATRKSQLTSQIKELEQLFDELNFQYATQKKDFNEAHWNTWSLNWRSKLMAIKSSNEDYRNKTLVLDFPVQENVFNELVYDLELIWNRYAAELFKMNNLNFEAPPSNDTRDSESLKKIIQDNLKTSKEFLMASKKSDLK